MARGKSEKLMFTWCSLCEDWPVTKSPVSVAETAARTGCTDCLSVALEKLCRFVHLSDSFRLTLWAIAFSENRRAVQNLLKKKGCHKPVPLDGRISPNPTDLSIVFSLKQMLINEEETDALH